jgi:hypothetical protein
LLTNSASSFFNQYAPPAAQVVQVKASEAGAAFERAIVPVKQQLRPMIADAKAKLDSAIAERRAKMQGAEVDSTNSGGGDAEAPLENDDEL